MLDILEFMGRLWYVLVGTMFTVSLMISMLFVFWIIYVRTMENKNRINKSKVRHKTGLDDDEKDL